MEDILMEMVKDRVDEKINTAVNAAVSTAEVAKEQETLVYSIRNVMDSFGVTLEKAMDSLKIPQSQ